MHESVSSAAGFSFCLFPGLVSANHVLGFPDVTFLSPVKYGDDVDMICQYSYFYNKPRLREVWWYRKIVGCNVELIWTYKEFPKNTITNEATPDQDITENIIYLHETMSTLGFYIWAYKAIV